MTSITSSLSGVYKQGWLNKKGQLYKNWRKRYFLLVDGFLMYFVDENDMFHPQGLIYLQEAFLDKDPFYKKKDNCLVIRSQGKRYMLSTDTYEEKEQWLAVLERVIQESSMKAKFAQSIQLTTPTTSGDANSPAPSQPNILDDLQKEKETSLRILQQLNQAEKPLNLLMNNVKDFESLMNNNDYISDTEKRKQKQEKRKRKKKKSADSSDDNSDSSHESSSDSDDDYASRLKVSKETDNSPAERTFTMTTTTALKVNPKNLSSPVDRLMQMREDIQTAHASYEGVKKKYQEQVKTYRDKVKVRKLMPRWLKRIEKLKKEQQKLKQNVDLMKKYMNSCIEEILTNLDGMGQIGTAPLPAVAAPVLQPAAPVSPTTAAQQQTSQSFRNRTVSMTKKTMSTLNGEAEMLALKASHEKLKDDMTKMKDKLAESEKTINELQHHKKLLIKEVKNLRGAK